MTLRRLKWVVAPTFREIGWNAGRGRALERPLFYHPLQTGEYEYFLDNEVAPIRQPRFCFPRPVLGHLAIICITLYQEQSQARIASERLGRSALSFRDQIKVTHHASVMHFAVPVALCNFSRKSGNRISAP